MTVVSLKTENPGVGFATHTDGVVKLEFSDGSSLILIVNYLPETMFPGGERDTALWEPVAGAKEPLVPQGAASLMHGSPPLVGRELASWEEEAFRFAASCCRAEKIALKLIARAEQNSLGLTAKLERRGFDASVVKAVVSRLLDRNLLDNRRYAELWIRSRLSFNKAPSPQWLLVALGKRGIDGSSSRKALDKVLDPQTEYALLLRYLEQERLPKGKTAFSLRAQLKHEGFSSVTLNRYFDN